jgi:hypothetical protein
VLVFSAVFLPLVGIYATTAQWSPPYHIDPITNAITGWYVGNDGTVVAEEHEAFVEEGQGHAPGGGVADGHRVSLGCCST